MFCDIINDLFGTERYNIESISSDHYWFSSQLGNDGIIIGANELFTSTRNFSISRNKKVSESPIWYELCKSRCDRLKDAWNVSATDWQISEDGQCDSGVGIGIPGVGTLFGIGCYNWVANQMNKKEHNINKAYAACLTNCFNCHHPHPLPGTGPCHVHHWKLPN